MKTNTNNKYYRSNALILYKETKQINSLFYQPFYRTVTFYSKSRKFYGIRVKDTYTPWRRFLKKLWKYNNFKEEQFTKSFPNGFLISYHNLEQLAAILYWKVDGDPKQKIYFSKIFNTDSNKYLDKPGIYMIQNNVTKKKYIGKASNILKRLENYCDYRYLENKAHSSTIYRNILKFGHNNFSFSIIEHCDLDKLSSRELHYISFYKPQYNIRKTSDKLSNKDYIDTLEWGIIKTPCPNIGDIYTNTYKSKHTPFTFINLEQIQRLLYEVRFGDPEDNKTKQIDEFLTGDNSLSLFHNYGVYIVRNKINNRTFIGKVSPKEDISLGSMLFKLCYIPFLVENAPKSYLYKDMLKFGLSNFEFSILEICDENTSEDLLIKSELSHINDWNPQYNIKNTEDKV